MLAHNEVFNVFVFSAAVRHFFIRFDVSFFFSIYRSASDIRHNQSIEEKSFEEMAQHAHTAGLLFLDGFSLRENDLLRISRPID